MRKGIIITLLIITLVIILLGISNEKQQSGNDLTRGFYIGPMNFFFEERLRTPTHLKWYDSLSFNIMQNYSGHFDFLPKEWKNTSQRDGGFFEDSSDYADFIRNAIMQWKFLSGRNSLIMEREKILRPAYGQRFTYQAEQQGKKNWITRFPAYGYDTNENMTGKDTTEFWLGENVTARKCIKGRDKPGYIVKNLIENLGQVNDLTIVDDNINSIGHGRLYSDIKQPKYNNRWFVKPRMRIDPDYAKSHPEDTVVVVYIKRFDGKIIDSTFIKCKNFIDYSNPANPQYNGQYLERYYNFQDSVNYLSVKADSLAIGAGKVETCKVDYIVKWLGKVDVCLDYVRVDDAWAHYLFTDTWQVGFSYPSYNIWKFRERIWEEVNAFKNVDGLACFWIDEVQFANLECIAEVNRLVKEYSDNKFSLIFLTDPIAFMGWSGLKYKEDNNLALWDSCINFAFKIGAISDIMLTQWFPVFYNTKYPSNLKINQSDSFPATRFFRKANNYDDYTYSQNSIQSAFSWYVRQHKYYIEKAKSLGLIYAVVNQINSDESLIKGTGGPDDWGLREPTCEEISAILNISLAHGAKILLEFSYTTSQQRKEASGFCYNMGLTTSNTDNYSNKRFYNYYYQEKWNYISELNRKLQVIGNYMYPYDSLDKHLKHENTITVNSVSYPAQFQGLPYSYVSDIRSMAPLISGVNPCMSGGGINKYYDCPEERYWELGFFNSTNKNELSKFLYVVNKRTFPNINNDGDLRILEIKFNPAFLPKYDNWKITDIANDSLLTTFNKNNSGYITIALFNPGEGKLLKISPAN